MKILFLVNSDMGLYDFRWELVEELIEKSNKVYISSPYGEKIEDFKLLGCEFIETKISRHGTNPFEDIKLLKFYKKIIKRLKPEIVFTYTIKPNIYGGIACKGLKIPYVANITGLGNAIENKGLLQKITLFLYKFSMKKCEKIFFQNTENQQFFINKKIFNCKYELLPGSGVNLEKFSFKEYPKEDNETRLLFIGRLLKDKGIFELAECAKRLLDKYKGNNEVYKKM